jgi:hypothetical protein
MKPGNVMGFKKSGRRDSNPLPTAWEAVALPGELLPLIIIFCRTATAIGIPLVGGLPGKLRIYAKVKFLADCSKIFIQTGSFHDDFASQIPLRPAK